MVEVTEPVSEGVVVLECAASGLGRLRDCVVISETPSGHGFDAAALDGAQRARLAPTAGRTTGRSKVRFTTRFRLAD